MANGDLNVVLLDGSVFEGGGQILRLAIALSVLLSKPISVDKIRHSRKPPGLKAQHAAGLRLAAEICSATLTGCKMGSTSIEFHPGIRDPFRSYCADPGTAGSVTLLLQIALPCLIFSPRQSPSHEENLSVDLTLRGGTNATQAPQIDYTEQVFFPFLRRHFGLDPTLTVRKRGYYPKGGGEVHFTIPTVPGPLPAFTLTDREEVVKISGKSWVAGTPRLKMADEMRGAAMDTLTSLKERESAAGSDVPVISRDIIAIDSVKEKPEDAIGSGSGIVLWAETAAGCRIGGSHIGEKKKKPNDVGKAAAEELLQNLAHNGCVDEYLQDQIIIFMALAEGTSTVRTGPVTEHTRAAIYVVEKLTEARFTIEEDSPITSATITCHGIGFRTS
ncbi:hypothetical protein EIP91_004796 [Steccherinum ochraceum]|uniref:RNA 3'-terminal phosphate cyclase n=1 Tax=Steccherinum ochraceum TaxID=92696 RepID=A0A4V2MVV0_9APHY|nr:hypothetical protein EIP91_004796 [Steccherinum ochraceum]